jgi:hypothetical protein
VSEQALVFTADEPIRTGALLIGPTYGQIRGRGDRVVRDHIVTNRGTNGFVTRVLEGCQEGVNASTIEYQRPVHVLLTMLRKPISRQHRQTGTFVS